MSSIDTFSAGLPSQIPLRAESATRLPDGDDRKLGEIARGFEATLLGQLLKEMRTTEDPEGGLFPGDSGDIHGGLFDLYMGQYLADAGGVGIAATLDRQLRTTYAPATGHGPPPAGGTVAGTVGR
jgi:flagellar protein FlgJ